jgi:osmoprotectant transport system substrate-binding protein
VKISRGRSLALIGAALVLPQCSGGKSGSTKGSGPAIRIGSKNFGENIIGGEIYAAALEHAGFAVERHMNLGSTQIAMAALERGDIDLYPEYTGTGLIDVLHMAPLRDAKTLYQRVRMQYQERFGIAWLDPSPGNDSQGLVITPQAAQRYNVHTLSQCASAAAQLRLAAVPEFVARADALPGLQKFYGGFKFKDVKTYDIGLQYDALKRGDADVATAFTTDAQIPEYHLVLLQDDRHFWPAYNIAPVVRNAALHAYPRIATVLNALAPRLTTQQLQSMNYRYTVGKEDAAAIARTFVAA